MKHCDRAFNQVRSFFGEDSGEDAIIIKFKKGHEVYDYFF